MANSDGSADTLAIELLRPQAWVERMRVEPGARLWLELPEMGIAGWASVRGLELGPPIAPGEGRVVLATVSHLNGYVRRLGLVEEATGVRSVLEPTATHRLYSEERQGWVAAGEVRVGERLRTRGGRVRVESVAAEAGVRRVYNLEVDSEHDYFVGAAQVLSHNVSPCAAPTGPAQLEFGFVRDLGATESTETGFINLASPQRTTHILTGDATGGGHLFPGGAGKSSFPQDWSADRVLHEISDVATDPSSVFTLGRGGRTVVTGTRDGVDIKVILGSQKEGGGIITGFPTNIPRNP